MRTKIDYHETNLDWVMDSWSEDLKHKDGKMVGIPEYFIDLAKKKVIFKMVIKVEEE